ncbi:MAG: hypothetical protein R3282_07095, partial [Rhodothermales bacterium]|nr:hypothetical protein [Rhodothermales bacterium]
MRSPLLVIAQREYVQRVTSKGFIVGTLLGPVIMIALIVVPVLFLVALQDRSTRALDVLDESGILFEHLEFPIEFDLSQASLPVDSLRQRLRDERIDGYLVLPSSLLRGEGAAEFYSSGGGGLILSTQVQQAVNRAVR